jgi:hypothetical protein
MVREQSAGNWESCGSEHRWTVQVTVKLPGAPVPPPCSPAAF